MPKKAYTLKITSEQTKTFSELMQELQAYNVARGLRPATQDFYTSHAKMHLKYVQTILNLNTADFPISIHTDAFIVQLINYLKNKGVKPGAINTHMAFTSTITKFAKERGYLGKAPKIIKMKQDKEVGETYLPWELELMLVKPDMRKVGFIPYRNWVIVCFFLSTGARLSSVENIKIKDLNISKQTVKLSHTKNRQGQTLPLSPKLVSILSEYLTVRGGTPNDALFCDYTGAPLSTHGIQQAVEQHNKTRGIKKHGIHAFRRTFATQSIRLGMSAFELQALLGHSTIEMTSRYVKAAELDLPTSVTRFNPLEQYELAREKCIFLNGR